MKPLRIDTLGDLPPSIGVPRYNPREVKIGIAHIGATSNFGRAFLMPHFDRALNNQQNDGRELNHGVVSIKTTSSAIPYSLSNMQAQEGLYTVISRNGSIEYDVVGAVRQVMNYNDDPKAVIDRLANPAIKMITITGSQSAYYLNADGDGLDKSLPAVKADMVNPFQPITMPGILMAALKQRQDNGIEAPLIISCDNLSNNGAKLGTVLRQYNEATKLCTPKYMATLKTPNTMVDRITPEQDNDVNASLMRTKGVVDHAAVTAEGFSKFMIEQPVTTDIRLTELARAGAIIVKDLKPYEDMKLRGLNGPHMALALVGILSGQSMVSEALAVPFIRPFVKRLMNQAVDTAQLPVTEKAGFPSEAISRFDNVNMPDTLPRLVKDTSSKVSARLINYGAIERGEGYDASAFAVAAWMRFMQGTDRNGNSLTIEDRNKAALSNTLNAAGFNTEKFLLSAGAKIFDVSALGENGLAKAQPFIAKVDAYYRDINKRGVEVALERAFGLEDTPRPHRPQSGQLAQAHTGVSHNKFNL